MYFATWKGKCTAVAVDLSNHHVKIVPTETLSYREERKLDGIYYCLPITDKRILAFVTQSRHA
jgi:hypothetical protein